MASENTTKVVVTLDYNGSKKRYRSQGSSWDDHWKSLSDTISNKFSGKSLNANIHVAVGDKVVSSATDLRSVLEGQSKVTLLVKDGQGVAMKIAIIICNGNKCKWQASNTDIENKSSQTFKSFCTFARKSFELGNDSVIKIYQIDNETDINNEDLLIEEADDFALCFDDVDVAYFCLKGDILFKGYIVEIDVSNAVDDEKIDKLTTKVPFTDTDNTNEWLKHFNKIDKEISKTLGNDSWQQTFALLDNTGVELPELDDFMLAFDDAGDNGGSSSVTVSFSLSKKEANGFTVMIDVSGAGINENLEMEIPKLDPESNKSEWESQFSGVCDKIESTLGIQKNELLNQYQLVDNQDMTLENGEEFALLFDENDGTSPICLTLQAKEDTTKEKLFIVSDGKNSVSWKPAESDKGKSWKIHYRKLLRILRKQYGNDEMRGMTLFSNDSNTVAVCDKLDETTIEKLWTTLNTSNNYSVMTFVISKSAPNVKTSVKSSHKPSSKVNNKISVKTSKKELKENDDNKEMDDVKMESEKDTSKNSELLTVSKIENNSKALVKQMADKAREDEAAAKLIEIGENDAIRTALAQTKKEWDKVEPHLEIVKNIANWEGGITPLTDLNQDFALSIQSSVKEVMHTRWDMQSSLMIVRSVMDLNPGSGTVGWTDVTKSCTDIVKMSLDVLEASIELNGGFLLLRNGISKMANRKNVRNLSVAVLPFERAINDFDGTVSKVAKTTSQLRGTIEKSLANIRSVAPGLKGGEEFERLLENIDELEKKKEEYNKQLDEKENELDKHENKFNGLLSEIAPSKVAEWHYKRLLAVQMAQEEQKKEQETKRHERSKKREKLEKIKQLKQLKSSKDEKDEKNEKNNQNEKAEMKNNSDKQRDLQIQRIQEVYNGLTINLETILNEKMPRQITKELEWSKQTEILDSRRQMIMKQKEQYEIALRNAAQKNFQANESINDQTNKQIAQIGQKQVDVSELERNIDKFGIDAANKKVAKLNASNYSTRTITDHHSCTTGWWFWRKRRTWTTTRTVTTYSGRKNQLAQQERAAREAAAAVTKMRDEKVARFQKLQQQQLEFANQCANLMKSNNDATLNKFKNHCQTEIAKIDNELRDIKNQEFAISQERKALEAECKRYKEDVRREWDVLQEKRKKFDKLSIECNKNIVELQGEQEKLEEKKDTWGMSVDGILSLFKVVPYLMGEAENATQLATRLGASFRSFAKLVSANKGKGLTFYEACERTNNGAIKILSDELANNSLTYCDDFSCDDNDEFKLLIEPTVIKAISQCQATKDLSDDQRKALAYRFKKFCTKQPYKDIQEETLETAKEELKDMAHGLDKFCGYIYEKSTQVDKLLTAYSTTMGTITLTPNNPPSKSAKKSSKQNKNLKAIKDSQPIVEEA